LILTKENYDTWLAHTHVVSQEGDLLRIAVPNALHKDWLGSKLRGRIMTTLQRLGYGDTRVEFVIAE
jgi:chromosomal replication initiation ATPase DnaA